jgi:hypothetical protein
MFINQIDEIINIVIDSIYTKKIDVESILKKNKILDLIEKKLYNNINSILSIRYSSNIFEMIEKLLLYLIILLSGVNEKDFTKYIVNLSKYSKLLDSEIISKIIKLYNLYDDIKLKKNLTDLEGIDESFLDVKNKKNIFNILKILIIKYIYVEEDRPIIIKLIENKELENSEFKYIEIIDSNEEEIDYTNLEVLFNINENKEGMTEKVYQMILDYDNYLMEQDISVEEKINYLFKKKIIIPITDEFLRYNKINDKIENTNIKIDKIRSVVTNINNVTNIYSKKNIEYEKVFYQPLIHRKVILYNNIEEIHSINKLVNIGWTAMRSNEYFQDLLIYRQYGYVNFNNFKNYGFSFLPYNSINAIRYSNFEFKNQNTNNKLETRVITVYNRVNVVGIALPKHNILKKHTIAQCTKIKNTFNLNKLYKNPYQVIVKKIKKLILNNEDYTKIGYWIFNKNNDILVTDTFNYINELSFEEFYRYMISTIYDILIDITYQKIINMLENCKTLYSCYYISDFIQNKLIYLPINTKYYNDLHNKIIDITKIKKKIKYDKNEDKIPGITTDLIKLPKIKDTNKKLINIRVEKKIIDEKYEFFNDNAICQHIISWNYLQSYKNKDPNYFNQLLFEFKKKYIISNLEDDFVCKSCYQSVDIKKYFTDWKSDTEQGITLSFTLQEQLENLIEYEKYKNIIKNLDRFIEKIAISVHIPSYIGSQAQIKIKRQEIIKNIIDLIIIQNKTLRISDTQERKKRLDEAVKLYGLNKDYTQFYIFELKNDIFIYSSKETDKFKRLKLNNIMIYIIMFMINEISINQILFFIEDKNINIEIFKKNYKTLFNNLKIYVNNNKEFKPLLNYPLLCYVLYIFAAVVIKYNLWFFTGKITGFDLNTYSYVIHTYVDLLNSILEVNTLKEKNYLYEVYATKFYMQLYQVFSDDKILSKTNKIQTIQKKQIILNEVFIPLTGIIQTQNFGYKIYYYRSALKFLTSITEQQIKIDKNIIIKSFENWDKELLDFLYNHYKLDGTKRLLNDPIDKNITKNDLLKMLQNIINKRKELSDKIEHNRLEYNNNINNIIKQDNENYQYYYKNYTNNYENAINLIKEIEKIVNMNLSQNEYIIDHDICGNKLKNPIVINEGDKKIQFKRNDIRFGTNIYIYEDNNNLFIYHGKTLNIIAYRNDVNKIINANLPLYLIINYSLKNKLLALGHEKNYYNFDIKENNKKLIIDNAVRNRIINLKNILINIQKILYQIYNKYDNINIDNISKIYMNKFKNINITLNNVEINNIINTIYFTPIDPNIIIQEDDDYIFVASFRIIKNSDSIILNYICNELSKLLKNNSNDKYIHVNLALMIIDIIKKNYDFYMQRSNSLNNLEVRKFIELKYQTLIFDKNENLDMFYEEKGEDEKNDDNEGFDVDSDPDIIDTEEEQNLFRIDD